MKIDLTVLELWTLEDAISSRIENLKHPIVPTPYTAEQRKEKIGKLYALRARIEKARNA